MPDIAGWVPEDPALEQPTLRVGTVVVAPASADESVGVAIDSFDPEVLYVVEKWQAREALPVVGDQCLVATDELGDPWIVVYWGPAGGMTPAVSAASLIDRIEFYGHSGFDVGTYDTSYARATPPRLCALLGASCADRSIGGAVAAWSEVGDSGDGGWGQVWRWTDAERGEGTGALTSAPYAPERDCAFVFLGANDVGWLGPDFLESLEAPLPNAMRAIVSRLRASAVWEEDNTDVFTFTGTWTDLARANWPTYNYLSGDACKRTTDAGASFEVAVPDDFPGGTVAVSLLSGSNGEGALWDLTVDGDPAGQFDTRDKNPIDYNVVLANPPERTGGVGICVKRFTELAAGAHTITFEINDLNVAGLVDCVWVESPHPPHIVLPKIWQPPSGDWSWMTGAGYPYTATNDDMAAAAELMDTIAAEFDAHVSTVDLEPAIGGDPDLFGDVIHLNEDGHALVAEALFEHIAKIGRKSFEHAYGVVRGRALNPNPKIVGTRGQNVIEPAFPNTRALVLRQSPRDMTPGLLGPWTATELALLSLQNRLGSGLDFKVDDNGRVTLTGLGDGDGLAGPVVITEPSAPALEVLSGDPDEFSQILIGRDSADDGTIGAVANADEFFSGSVPDDVAIGVVFGGTRRLLLGVSNLAGHEAQIAISQSGADLTGTPTAPTQTADNDSTRIATTAYVVGQAMSSGVPEVAGVGAAARGTSKRYARADHVHALPDFDTWFGLRSPPMSTPGSVAVSAAKRQLWHKVLVEHRCTLTGIGYFVGGTTAGNVRAALYDSTGARVANRTSNVAMAAAGAFQQIAFDSTVDVDPGWYFVALIFDNTGGSFWGSAILDKGSAATQGTFVTATSITVPTTVPIVSVPYMTTY
jgi:hypothetical protein